MRGTGIIGIVYIVIGILVAAQRDYFDGIDNLEGIVSALLAVVLWPLILLGVDLDIGGGKDKGRDLLIPLVPMWAYLETRFKRT